MPTPTPTRTPVTDERGMLSWPWLKWLQEIASRAARPVQNLTVYADNAAAVAGGLKAGDAYRTGADPDVVCVVH